MRKERTTVPVDRLPEQPGRRETKVFAVHDGDNQLVGVFTCRCPGDNVVNFAKILKAKGAEVIHWCTCLFSHKKDGAWVQGDGFCEELDSFVKRVVQEAGIPCVMGTAHLPQGL